MSPQAETPKDGQDPGEAAAARADDVASSLDVRVSVAIVSSLVGGAIGGLIFALGVGSFFPKVHVVTGWFVCEKNETLEAGTERGGVDENYVVCEHGETQAERDVEGKAFWALAAMSGGLIFVIVFVVHLRTTSPKRAAKRSLPRKTDRGPPEETDSAEDEPDQEKPSPDS